MPRSLWIAFVAAGVCLVLAACHRSEPSGASLALTDSAASAPDADRAVANAPGARERKLVRNAGLRLEVEEYAAARERIEAALARVKGHVARARVEHADGALAFASLELRVPAAALDGFVREVARFGTVLHEEMRTDEISDEYYDAQARLESARKLEQRLLQFADTKTSDVKDLLEVERELGRVREGIEALAGRVAGYDDQVALSSLSLDMVSRQRVSMGTTRGLGARLRHTFRESFEALSGAGRGVLVVFAFLLPWLPIFVLGGYLGRRLLRR